MYQPETARPSGSVKLMATEHNVSIDEIVPTVTSRSPANASAEPEHSQNLNIQALGIGRSIQPGCSLVDRPTNLSRSGARHDRLGAALLELANQATGQQSSVETAVRTDRDPRAERQPTAQGDDRSALPRRDSRCVVSVHLLGQDPLPSSHKAERLLHSCRLKGELVDISMNGLALLLHEPIEQGSRVLLRLANRRVGRTLDLPGYAVRAASQGNGQWKVMCRFDQKLTFEQAHDFCKYDSQPADDRA
jgi:hypothetical protein